VTGTRRAPTITFRVPATARAGRRFVVRFTLRRASAGSAVVVLPAALTCSAVLGDKPLHAVAKSVAARAGACVWRLPKGVTGVAFHGVVRVAGQPGSARRTFARRVR
jgi:hypothetical protein